jgi:hypothetical protein
MSKTIKKIKIMPIKKKAVKKVVKKPTPKSVEKELVDMLKAKGFTYENDFDMDTYSYKLLHKNKGNITTLSFNKEILPYCCGVIELGDFIVRGRDYLSNSEKAAVEILIAIAFLEVRKGQITGYSTSKGVTSVKSHKPIVFCSNGIEECVFFENAARKYLKGYYKLVSTSVNPGSGNTIKMFVSQV